MKKVLHILKSQKIAGAESHVFDLLPRLAKRGYEVSLLNLFDMSKGEVPSAYKRKLDSIEGYGVNVYREKVEHNLDVKSVLKILSIIEDANPNLVHTHMPFADLFGGAAAKWGGYGPVLSTRHQDYSSSWREWARFVIYYSVAGFFLDSMIAVSRQVASLATDYEAWDPSDIEVIPHGCSHVKKRRKDSRKRLVNSLSIKKDSIIIVTVARLIPLKGHRFAIKSLSELKNKNVDVNWIFVGDGPERKKLLNEAKREGVEDSLHILGYRDDVPSLLSGVDMMVHPTTAEAFGIVLIEAMVQETPIIATDVGAVPEVVVDGKTGVLVPPRDPSALAHAVLELIEDKNKRKEMGRAGRERFEKEFTIEAMVARVENAYSKIIQ